MTQNQEKPLSETPAKHTSELPPVAPNSNPPPSQAVDPVSQPTNMLAVLSLVFSFVFNIIGLILGIIALKQIKNSGEAGKGFAVAGVVISSLSMLFTILVIGLVIIGGIAGFDAYNDCVESGRTDCGNEITDELKEDDSSNTKAVSLDTFTAAGELRIKANSVEEYDGGEFNKPNQGNIYLNVELEVENDGFDTRNITSVYATIKDSENRKYNQSSLGVPLDAPTIDGELPSKEIVKGIVGFEVPKDSSGLKLYFESGKHDGKIAVIDLGR